MPSLVLVRHGQSQWNLENRFTGWWDVDLSDQGEKEAREAGARLAAAGIRPDVVHTSVLTRAIRTTDIALHEMGLLWLPVLRHWRLNERHYGALTGLNKAEVRATYGEGQFVAWRRSYDTPPPPLEAGSPYDVTGDPRYGTLGAEMVPATECLADVLVRLLPYWYDHLVPALAAGQVVLVSAHGNSLRALIKHLDAIPDDEIVGLELPTGVPMVYELDGRMRPVAPRRYLNDESG